MRPAAIFDVDGTLVDSRKMISLSMQDAFQAEGLAPPSYDDVRKIVGLSLDVAIDRLAPREINHEALMALIEAYKVAFVARRTSTPDFEPLYEGVTHLLDVLKASDWKMGIATGKSRRGLDAIMKTHALGDYFEADFCASEGPGKPDPFMVEANLAALDVDPSDTVMIGDTTFDMLMGNAVGAYTIGVTWGFHTRQEIETSEPDLIVETMGDLQLALLDFQNTRLKDRGV